MTKSNFKDHFSSAHGYAAYRPTYPLQLVDELAKVSPGHKRALDCGCGTGQLSVLLSKRFDEVIATDASAAQIAKAQHHHGVKYIQALAEESGLPDASVDLITSAQAAHWFDLDKFYAEVRRVSRPQAILALITYGVFHIDGPMDSILQRFYYETVGPYWPAERRHVEESYKNLPFPFLEIPLPDLAIQMDLRLEDLIGYIHTWSAVNAAEKALGFNPVDPFREELSQAWGDGHTRRQVTWPLSLRVGRVDS